MSCHRVVRTVEHSCKVYSLIDFPILLSQLDARSNPFECVW